MLLLLYSVLFFPFFLSFISVFQCQDGYHYLLLSMKCYAGQHIGMIILSCIGITLFVLINLMIATLYNETQPVKENSLSRLDSNFELIMLVYRITMSILSQYCFQGFCSWIIIVVSLLSSIYFLFQYFKFLPYYNTSVSFVFGAMLGVYFWISLNALLAQLYSMVGFVTIIFIGLPFVVLVMRKLRQQKIEWLMQTTIDKFTNDIDCLNQIITFQEWHQDLQSTNTDNFKEVQVKGFLNLHFQECENITCVCSRLSELYDTQNDRYLSLAMFGLDIDSDGELPNKQQKTSEIIGRTDEIHKSEVFIINFNQQLYKDGLQKFINSVSIHILFAYYYFTVMKNVHASLHELKLAEKKRPNIYQQFTIYRYQNMIELYIQAESQKYIGIYDQLTNVKEFESLFSEIQKKIEKVCNYQVEFWTHLASVIPDLNYLNSLNNQIVNTAADTQLLWNKLNKINPNYHKALVMYAEYMTVIRNNIQVGKEYFDKANKLSFSQKLAHDNQLSSDVLFSDEAVVVHVSGNRDSSGKIVKVSQGLKKCFGWDRQEVMGQNIGILMPNLFAQKHNKFINQYYHTARQQMFNKERSLFASHKTGYCFSINLMLKQMPSLKEGIQYVGMMKPQITDNDYIITDNNGFIDTFSSGIGLMFNLNPSIFKDSSSVNIQLIAPELMHLFNSRSDVIQGFSSRSQSQNSTNIGTNVNQNKIIGQQKVFDNNRFSSPGGDVLNFYIPNNFFQIVRAEHSVRPTNRPHKSQRFNDSAVTNTIGNTLGSTMNVTAAAPSPTNNLKQSPQFKELLRYISKGGSKIGRRVMPDLKELLNCKEYKEHEISKSLTVEIREWAIPLGNSMDNGLKMLLFIIPKNQAEKKPQELQSFDRKVQVANVEPLKNTPLIQLIPASPLVLNQNTKLNSKITEVMTRNQTNIYGNLSFSNSLKNTTALKQTVSFNGEQSNYVNASLDNIVSGLETAVLITEGVQEKPIDLEAFERQETDEIETDQELLDTERIDVKQDIALNDEMMDETIDKVYLLGHHHIQLQKKESGASSRIKPPQAEYIVQSIQNQELEEISSSEVKIQLSLIKDDDDYEGNEYDEDYDDEFEENEKQDEVTEVITTFKQTEEEYKSDQEYLIINKRQPRIFSPNSNRSRKGGSITFDQEFKKWAGDKPLVNQKHSIKVRDYKRIVTNPKYKYFDEETCGSAYFNDCNASEKEIDIRDTFKKVYVRKVEIPKPSKKKNKETAVIDEKSENKSKKGEKKDGDNESSDLSDLGEDDEASEKLLPEEDQTQEQSLVEQSNPHNQESFKDNINIDENDQSSVASLSSNQTRTYYSLKLAIDEKYIPKQVKNLRVVATLVWVAVIIMALAYFGIQTTLFNQIQSYISIIENSEKRIDSIMTITMKLTDIALINENWLTPSNIAILSGQLNQSIDASQFALQVFTAQFLQGASDLMAAQKDISQQTISLTLDSRQLINPPNVTLKYFDLPSSTSLPTSYSFNIWEAIVQISVFAQNVAQTPLMITHMNPQVQFITFNCMNSILLALQKSTTEIVSQSNSTLQSNNQTFLILLLSISGALILSMFFLLPVIRGAKNNKQEVFELFTLKQVQKQIEEQIKKNRWFIGKYQQQLDTQTSDFDEGLQGNAIEIQENVHIEAERDLKRGADDKKDDYILKVKKQKKKWKPLDKDLYSIFLKFILVLMLIETYFLYTYFTSQSFLNEVASLTNELRLLISRQSQLQYLMLMEKQMVYSNSTDQYLFQTIRNVSEEAMMSQNTDYLDLQEIFETNYFMHSSSYNLDYITVMRQDMCSALIPYVDLNKCQNINDGILQNGGYNAVVKYCSQLGQTHNDFFGSTRNVNERKTLINDGHLINAQVMSETYLNQSHLLLVGVLHNDINVAFSSQYSSVQTVFVFFLVYIILIYLLVWRFFMKGLLNELWRAKACLNLLPVEVCFQIEAIRTFIYSHSSGLGVSN